MKILFDVTPAQKTKILEILKLTAVVDVLLDKPQTPDAYPLKIAEGTEPQDVTREDVAAAVLARAKRTSSADAIGIMELVGGSPQLAKINPDQYGAVILALNAEPAEG